MTTPMKLELPVGAELVYLAEGGANVIYRILLPTKMPASQIHRDVSVTVSSNLPSDATKCYSIPPTFKRKLLRLRKDTSAGIPYQEIARNFDRCIRPLFEPDELVDQELVYLPRGLVQLCNEQLLAAERTGQRPKRRHGVYLSTTESFGLLITDMTTFGSPGATLSELKPKWLVQSPSAPAGSLRCRTCALRDMKNHQARKIGDHEEVSFCPLDLVSDQFENVLRATRFITACEDQVPLAMVLYQNSTLQRLLAHQNSMCDVGLQGPPVVSVEKSLGMTLRDCTMFIRISNDESRLVEVRLGDLDLKTGAGGKAKYWVDLEHRLIDEGWYMGAKGSGSANSCALQDSRCNSQSM
ncbi:inositol-pentakisphosphate 2-kinase [Aspergillus saccharolyticus JOP 1030-1]|uniref:Inositol-pentakisphosphate 2-kinase n=1 Tax=Aspergillus saccharolyticus JOP 1030-1 TaxID=1450539 RepID=A0A318ZZH8_9EURO|nr:inositol-pentakisphosphate 2-kinase [Aspergillus saccharolyticus JOP 1030-1]PYH40762.1 inositol-pentakisphosphate 2-kinase [Aspergillus saccharolyticus JOP 1030-1]